MITDTQSFKVFFLNIQHVINKYIPLIIKTQSLIVKHFAQKHYE